MKRAPILHDPLLRKGGGHKQVNRDGEICPACKGRGYIRTADDEYETCQECGGEGVAY